MYITHTGESGKIGIALVDHFLHLSGRTRISAHPFAAISYPPDDRVSWSAYTKIVYCQLQHWQLAVLLVA